MKLIDIENWKRKDHYNFFRQVDYPHFNICGNIDITKFYKYIKENELPFFISILYASTKTANSIKEFKLRIRGDKVIEHETVNPSFTIITDEEVFSFCRSNYTDNFNEFKTNTLKEIEKVKNNISIEDEPGQDDLLYITSIPWVSFTNITHPIQMNPVDSIPRIAWGKYFEEGGNIKLPISVDVHHALVDGVHIGQYFNIIQEIIDNPAKYL
ncbi:chloramphenicol acetyltransferase [Clostridium botulinum]|uniref:chloramphenicol acetyltransferase n=1 Tax=Clostridium TaxID=1485 RepID=UPI0002D7D879|nr:MULTISPECIES: chloramphenicol acetyltransferase [unclassified Clostridium]AIY78828.1 chloramphenicol acetyltransferase family protein [Clostridium botulinum 202F]KAI3346015.1 chloramphenicol acetyltransferase [Clostridium botulinum]KFX55385.1 chloramphenicol acetyltransferase [Clostridium botulinum]KFX55961.1 chloramphenicol acetyltransferase [Clostridium botulinum]KON13419.1 chloramphenicol acetyltransferase [Clostridium botulinum]